LSPAPRRFVEVDVFGERPLTGNPLAVVVDAVGLETDEMHRITRWMNLSETAFLLPPTEPGADYKVRIFTLSGELPFAGHPTLGSCHAWLTHDGLSHESDTIIQECGAGLVSLRRSPGLLAFEAPHLIRSGPVDGDMEPQLADVLGISSGAVVDIQWADNGPGWVALLLDDAESVLALEADPVRFSDSGNLGIGVVGFYPPGSEIAYEVRAFFRDDRGKMIEDPVTGSLNASIAQWMLASGRATAPYVASQGTALGRSGRIMIDQDEAGRVWVGGRVTTVVTGFIEV
jgi:PhzF family phenazine biosynthesis protein